MGKQYRKRRHLQERTPSPNEIDWERHVYLMVRAGIWPSHWLTTTIVNPPEKRNTR